MDAQVKLKERLPHGAIKNMAKMLDISFVVVSAVINDRVEVKCEGGCRRICSEATEAKIKTAAASIISQQESMMSRAMKQVQELTSTHPLKQE